MDAWCWGRRTSWFNICVYFALHFRTPVFQHGASLVFMNSNLPCITKSLVNKILTHWPQGNSNEIFRHVIFKQILVIHGWGISCEITLRWMSLNFTDDNSILVKVMAWCRQATSHYLSQCWPRSLSPYGVTRSQGVNALSEAHACPPGEWILWLSGEPDYFGRNKISNGGDLSHYSSASLY